MKGMGKYKSFNSTASSGLSMSYYLTANLSGEGVVRVIQQNNLTGAQPHGAENSAQNSISSLGTRAGPCIKLFSLNIILGLQRTKKSHQNRICILPNEIACRYVGPLLQGPLYSFSQTMEDESASDETKIDLSVNCPEVKLTLRSATQSLIMIQVNPLSPF